MLKKLRFKFIAISTLAMVVVLFLVLGLVNLVTYSNALSDINSTLDYISSQEGEIVAESESITNYSELTPETAYETRYLFLVVGSDGAYVTLNDEHIAAITKDEMDSFIANALSDDETSGIFQFKGLYYAYLKEKSNDQLKLTIMDCTRTMSSVHYFFTFSLYVGALSSLLTLLVLSFFAKRVVAPYVKNNEAQKQFITNASHELKTPLAVISANTEVIEMMNGKNEWTESTVNQVSRMSELISRLVVLSRLEEREDIVLKDVDYSAEAAKSVANFKTVAETKGLTLESVIEEDIHVEADEKGIFELINILLDNAVKYCDDGGAILIVLSKKGKYSSLVVSNDYAEGEGVDYKRFFDRFYREDQSHNSSKKGYGIGLSMAESLTRMFKGKIHVTYKKPIISFTVII